jgi:hypothetical protein
MYNRVGQFLTFFILHAGIRCPPCKNVENNKKKFFRSIDLYRRGHYILGHALYRGQKIFFHNVGLMGIKRLRILRRFQKYKLTLVTKCT